MSQELEIRESVQRDAVAIESLYPEAFPDEDLVPLVRELLQDRDVAVSLVATIDGKIVGHGIFTLCGVTGSSIKAALLGPLAVSPARQRHGIGTAIVRTGLKRLEEAGASLVCVLGDPAYYERLGFVPETGVKPPYALPPEWSDAWQAQYIGEMTTPCTGKLVVPSQWRQPALWLP